MLKGGEVEFYSSAGGTGEEAKEITMSAKVTGRRTWKSATVDASKVQLGRPLPMIPVTDPKVQIGGPSRKR